MPNSSRQYCTVPELKQELGIPTSNESNDLSIDVSIEAVSRQIDDYTHRQFFGASQTRYYTADNVSRLLTDDILSITTLRTDDNGDTSFETTWSTAAYVLAPFNATLQSQPQPYTEILLHYNSTAAFPIGITRGVQITGVFGFATATPPVVHKAALLQAAMNLMAKDAPAGFAGGTDFGQEQRTGVGGGLHPFIRRMLDPLRNRVHGA